VKHLYGRLFFWFFAANVVTLLLSVGATERLVRWFDRADPDWAQLAGQTEQVYATDGSQGLTSWTESWRRKGVDIGLYDQDGRNLVRRAPPPPVVANIGDLLTGGDKSMHMGSEGLLVSYAVNGPDDEPLRFIALRKPHLPRPAGLLVWLSMEIVISLGVITAIGGRLSRSIVFPIAAVQRTARRVAEGDLTARVGTTADRGGMEVAQLAHDFDYMAARVESLIERNRALLQDLSHELRSPLARLQLALELARADLLPSGLPHFERAEREVGRIDEVLAGVLALERVEAQLPGKLERPFDLAELIEERKARFAPEADAKSMRLKAETGAGLVLVGERSLMVRALDNLISNAIKYAPAGSEVKVSATAAGENLELSVEDQGAGVPEAEREALFRPFFRGRSARGIEGQGLGLSIVERIARAHGGSVSADAGAHGGLRVTLHLPRKEDSDVGA
jgi:signal transduction histidine kinase